MNTTQQKPLIALTMGDPCGIGPEIIVKALASEDVHRVCRPLIVGSPLALDRAAHILDTELEIRVIPDLSVLPDQFGKGTAFVFSPSDLTEGDIPFGRPSKSACLAVISFIETAVRMAMDGNVSGVCTCPIHKANLHRHGFAFPGHTEFLRDLTGSGEVVMMLAGPRLRVSLVTIHNAISEVPGLLSTDVIANTIRITGEALLGDFAIRPARIAVAGLNPHAGEEGRFGNEEQLLIQPAVERFTDAPYSVSGPYPPDTLFHRAHGGEFDAVVAMYHDQGLIPLKLVHFHDAVNVSLGLPIIRTSVDHGTAYDLAGSGKALPGSLIEAIKLAAAMAKNRRLAEGSS